MEHDEFQTLWQQAQPLQPNAALVSQPRLPASTQRQAAAVLGALRPLKVLALALGLGWVVLVDAVLVNRELLLLSGALVSGVTVSWLVGVA